MQGTKGSVLILLAAALVLILNGNVIGTRPIGSTVSGDLKYPTDWNAFTACQEDWILSESAQGVGNMSGSWGNPPFYGGCWQDTVEVIPNYSEASQVAEAEAAGHIGGLWGCSPGAPSDGVLITGWNSTYWGCCSATWASGDS